MRKHEQPTVPEAVHFEMYTNLASTNKGGKALNAELNELVAYLKVTLVVLAPRL